MSLPLITAGLSKRDALFPISLGRRHGLSARVIRGGWLVASVVLMTSLSPAQEALRNSLAGDAATEARLNRLESLPYTFKMHDLRVLVTPSLAIEWNDNINISRTNSQQDFIIRPSLQLDASYPLTERNLLSLTVGVGYQKYIEHDEHSSLFLQSESGTELSLDVVIKDFWINFHDRVQYYRDTSQQSELAGTADYATINNTVGLNATWDLNDVTLSAGYDHQNAISTSQQFNYQDHATELLFARVGVRLHPTVTAGIEATTAFTTYDQTVLNDNTSYSLGVYGDWQPGKYFRVQPRVGYTISKYRQTSQSIQTSDLNSWYANLNISHQATDTISYFLDAGHEVRLGVESDAIESWYLRPTIRWNIFKNLGLNTFFSYEHGKQGAGNVTGNLTETYDWIGTGITASYAIMKKLSLSLNYRLTLRSSDTATRDYTQNVVGLMLTYQTQ